MIKQVALATSVLVFCSIVSAICFYMAKIEYDMRFTILGFMSAVFGGMFYGQEAGWNIAQKKSKVEKKSNT